MSTTGKTMDAASKRWLAALAIAFLAAVAVLTHSFINVLSPPERSDAKTRQVVTDRPEEAHALHQLEWSRPQEFHAVEAQHATTSPFASNDSDAAKRKKDEAVREEMVHQQAESLRSLVKQNKLPEGYGHLTVEQIDEMEKKGIVIQ